jgi:dTDP-4-dehydrorhamnose reductase
MSVAPGSILMTGGSGRLGTELQLHLPGLMCPDEVELDITSPASIDAGIAKYQPAWILHAAAYTNVGGAETDRATCWKINVDGTRNVVAAAMKHGLGLIHISTDYVFDGKTGGYREDDPVGPAFNYYALTKLVAEAVVRMHEQHVVIRTSFRDREWPYPKAFTDVFTGQDYVDIIGPQIAMAIAHADEITDNTLHIVTERKSAFDLAQRRRPDVAPGSKADAGVTLPDDVSLDISRWERLKTQWS